MTWLRNPFGSRSRKQRQAGAQAEATLRQSDGGFPLKPASSSFRTFHGVMTALYITHAIRPVDSSTPLRVVE